MRRALVRLGFALTLGAVTLFLAWGLAEWLPRLLGRADMVLVTGGLGLGVLVARAAPPLWRRLDAALFADVYDERRTLHDLTDDLTRLRDRGPGAVLCRRLARETTAACAAILVQAPSAPPPELPTTTPAAELPATTPPAELPATTPPMELLATSCPLDAAPLAALTREATAVATADPAAPLRGVSGQVALWVPLRTGGQLYGLLALGPKRNGEPYSRTDRRLLYTAAGTAAAALHGAELAAQLRRRAVQLESLNRQLLAAHEEERYALARALHDGPLARLVLVTHLLATRGEDRPDNVIWQQSATATAEHATCAAVCVQMCWATSACPTRWRRWWTRSAQKPTRRSCSRPAWPSGPSMRARPRRARSTTWRGKP